MKIHAAEVGHINIQATSGVVKPNTILLYKGSGTPDGNDGNVNIWATVEIIDRAIRKPKQICLSFSTL